MSKGTKRQREQQDKAKKRKQHGKPGTGKSKYGMKHAAQKRGYFSDTSPLRFGGDSDDA